MAPRILWVSEQVSMSDGIKLMLNKSLNSVGIMGSSVSYASVHAAASREAKEPSAAHYSAALMKYVTQTRATVVVCSCAKTLVSVFMPELHRLRAPLAAARGSLFWLPNDVPVLCIDRPQALFVSPTSRWIFLQDLAKLARWAFGKQRTQPKFAYTVCRDLDAVLTAKEFLLGCVMMSCDIETQGTQHITAVGYTGLRPDGQMHTYVFPLWNPLNQAGRMFAEEVEVVVWESLREINACAAVKVFQNGPYDNSHFIRHHMPSEAWLLDTLHMWHSLFTEAPKRLDVISSCLLDYYRYWKEENKGTKQSKATKFKNWEGMERYWRYNALDCYNTLLNARVLLALLNNIEWARDNYVTEFSLQVGPCLAMSMRGMLVQQDRLHVKRERLLALAEDNLRKIRTMAADPDFNPASAQQFGELLFGLLGAKMPTLRGKAAQQQKAKKSPYSVDEKVLKLVALQHPILEAFIKAVQQAKQPRSAASKYDPAKIMHPDTGRFMYFLGAAGTETGRLSGRKSCFWIGTNPQNVPGSIRDFAIPDPGYVFFEPDFSQSDAMFVAYESGDETFIRNMTSGKDTHCLHAAHFFRPLTYEEIYAGHKSGDPFFADDVTGIRAVTKKIVHGKNYNMAGFTLYMLMGRAAVIAAATAKGHKDVAKWEEAKLVSFCQSLLNDYDSLYPGLASWKTQLLLDGSKNGNRIQVAYGRTRQFFGDLKTDAAAQREAIAYYGQGGTAGNTNRTMLEAYFRKEANAKRAVDAGIGQLALGGIDGPDCMMLSQTHDSLLFQIREDMLHHYAQRILAIMEKPVTINGREMLVRAEGKAGYCWGRGLVKYHPALTLADLRGAYDKIVRDHTVINAVIDFTDLADEEEADDGDEAGSVETE